MITQKISPEVFASAARMASMMRARSASEIIVTPSPASGRAAAAERAAAPGKAAAKAAAKAARRAGGPRRARGADPPASARAAAAVARNGADEREEHQPEHEDDEQHDQQRAPVYGRLRSLGRALLPFGGVAGEHADDIVDAAVDAAGKVVGAKARDDRVLDDEPRDRVGERAFEPVADLDAHLALVWRHDQHHAVVLVLLSDPPAAAELDPVILDRGALQRLERHHHELVGGLGLERGELVVERRARGGIEDVGLVHHAAAEGGKLERRRGESQQSEKERKEGSEREAWVRRFGSIAESDPPHPNPLPNRSRIHPTSAARECRTRASPSSDGERARTESA